MLDYLRVALVLVLMMFCIILGLYVVRTEPMVATVSLVSPYEPAP
jgi:hypothetical protein